MKAVAHRSGFPLLLLAISAIAAESQPPGATDAPTSIVQHRAVDMTRTQLVPLMRAESAAGGSGEERVLRFATGEEQEQLATRMRERLNDPAQRPGLVAEQRAVIERSHVDAAKVLGLDATTERNLIDLLTEQQMAQLDRLYEQPRGRFDMQLEADSITRRNEGLRALLGEEGRQRYQRFADSLGERHQVNDFGAQLDVSDALRPDQKEKLIDVLFEQRRRAGEQVQSRGWQIRPWRTDKPIAEQGLQRQSGLQIGLYEAHLSERMAAHREIESQAAAFLAPSQLNALSQRHRNEETRLQRYITSLRSEAGMDPTVPEQSTPPVEDARALVNAFVQVDVRLKVNGAEEVPVTVVVQNGEPFTFDAAEGLIAEATPRLYDDNWLDLHMKYYEKGAAGGRRALQGGGMFGVQTRRPDGLPSGGGGGGIVVGGSKGYAVELTVTASALSSGQRQD